jgi:hypothetical protein
MCFEHDVKILNDPNIWVADTAATVHSTPHKVGMRNAKQASKADSVRMGNGADVEATTIAQIPGVICDKDGHELKEVVLDSVTHLPGAKYNLFSLSKMIRQGGWKLHGDNKAIWLEKDGVEIRFDIIIPTPRGALYCMNYKRQAEAVVRDGEIAMSAVDHGDLQGPCSDDEARLEAKSQIGVVSEPRLQCETCAKTKANVHTRKHRMPERASKKNVPMIERKVRKKVPMSEHRERRRVSMREHKAAENKTHLDKGRNERVNRGVQCMMDKHEGDVTRQSRSRTVLTWTRINMPSKSGRD